MENAQYYPIEFDSTGTTFNVYNNGTYGVYVTQKETLQ